MRDLADTWYREDSEIQVSGGILSREDISHGRLLLDDLTGVCYTREVHGGRGRRG